MEDNLPSTHPPGLLNFGQLAAMFAHAGDLDLGLGSWQGKVNTYSSPG